MNGETKDTTLGLLRRTGPASAELLDQDTGQVYGFNFAAAAQYQFAGERNGREIADDLFFPNRPPLSSNEEKGGEDE